ncbi:hypothetical protein ACIQRS_05215 [Streptomyces termitum]|uniref:Zinc-ribbon domain-containing protein n=1 Tax=Streptomyces termitum TaxID=67368 RepID=A0A918W6A4_9ACTN|nr:hypothetical protein [Streptomyces termitum]GHA77309.1 hypothetical protein GCM10010305_20250 [Streptomyces termitum]
MSRRIDPDAAAAVMRAAGLEPLEPYPGWSAAWACRCLKSAHRIAPTYGSVRSGATSGCRRCGRAAAAARKLAAGSERAEADMRGAGFQPLEPYPGAAARWRCRHLACGRVVHPRLFSVRAGSGCLACAGRAPVDAAVAEAELRAAGMLPLVPFPGRVRTPWPSRCTRCGRTGAPSLNNIRRGQGACVPCAWPAR